MKLTVCKKICKECPFSTGSLKGWLGSHKLDDVLVAQQKSKLFSCHLQRQDGMSNNDIKSGKIQICRGFLASASKSGMNFTANTENNSELRELQVLVETEDREDMNTILSSQEFREHHGGPSAVDRIPVSQEIINRRRGHR